MAANLNAARLSRVLVAAGVARADLIPDSGYRQSSTFARTVGFLVKQDGAAVVVTHNGHFNGTNYPAYAVVEDAALDDYAATLTELGYTVDRRHGAIRVTR